MKYQFRCDGMLTLECHTPIRQTLNKAEASELTALVAKDLHAVLKIKGATALVFCGAAFATEQLLQPKFPLQTNITQYASAAFQGELNVDQVLSIGANNKSMPDGLQPEKTQQNLVHLPFCLYTNDERLAEQFEANLMHKGMISPPTYEKISALTQVQINHANYMTYMDLVAMMHNHYEQLGLSHVWQVIETALVNNEPKTAVISNTHNHFYLVDHLLFTPFFSWSQFSEYFATKNMEDYVNWLMAQRLSIAAFVTHGLEIKAFKATEWPINDKKVCLGQFDQQRIKLSYWTELTPNNAGHPDQVLYHQHPQAGIVAISYPTDDGMIAKQYPITPLGIKAIEQLLQRQKGPEFEKIHTDVTENSNCLL